jgi:hypothetical protein
MYIAILHDFGFYIFPYGKGKIFTAKPSEHEKQVDFQVTLNLWRK